MPEVCVVVDGEEELWLDLEEAESFGELYAFNAWTFAKWDALGEDKQWKKTRFSAAKWKWKTMHCGGGAVQYSFDPSAPDYSTLTGEAPEE